MLPLPDTTTATRKNIARKYKLSEFPDPTPFLHIRCGGDILDKLTAGGVPGDPIRWTDVLCEGPLHRHWKEGRRQRERAAYLAVRYRVPMTETYREIMGQDWRVTQCVRYDETVLWCGANLGDQIILVYLLARLWPLATKTKISLICLGDYPGLHRFVGLGQLGPAQLAELLPTRQRVTRRQFALSTEAWRAFQSSDPRRLQRIARMRTKALPFLPEAIRRYLAEYPSIHNGLSQTAQWGMEAIAAGAKTPGSAFRRVQQLEMRPFQDDSMFYAVVRELASGRRPALEGGHPDFPQLPDHQLRDAPVWLTDRGRAVLAGTADWCRLWGGIRQVGGMTFRGGSPTWRWDPEDGRARLQKS